MTTRTPPVSIEQILDALDSEERYQISRWGDRAHDRSFDEWIMYIATYAAEAQSLTTHGHEEEAKDHIRKVASMCVHLMTQYGVNNRSGF